MGFTLTTRVRIVVSKLLSMVESQFKLKQIKFNIQMVPGVPGSSCFPDIIVNISKMLSLCWYNCNESRFSGTDCEGKFLLSFRR